MYKYSVYIYISFVCIIIIKQRGFSGILIQKRKNVSGTQRRNIG